MKRLVLMLLVICLLPGAAGAFAGEGTRLDPSSLPEDWALVGEYSASPSDLERFSAQLGAQVVLLRNYLFSTPIGQIQINWVLTETETEAEALHELFLGFHPPEMVGRSGRRVLEIVTEYPELVEPAKAALRFVPEEADPLDQAAVREYLSSWSWSVPDWESAAHRLVAELENYRVFLVGESHGASCNQQLESAILECLVLQGGVRNLLLELSPSIVGFLREYVETGDETLLDLAFSSVKGTYFFTQENYAHWQNIRTLRQALPAGESLRLIGLDVEHQPLLALQYLQRLMDHGQISGLSTTKLANIGRVLQGELSLDYAGAVSFVEGLLLELETEQAQDALGGLVDEFELVLSSLLAGLKLHTIEDGVAWNNSRDQAMYRNFLTQVSPAGGDRYFGQWGLNHVFQGQQAGVDWLGSLISNTDGFSNAVCSLAIVYADGEQRSQDGKQVLPLSNYAGNNQILAELAGDEPLLVKLDGINSPFGQKLVWKLRDAAPTRGVTTDYFQYLLFVPKTTASKPLAL